MVLDARTSNTRPMLGLRKSVTNKPSPKNVKLGNTIGVKLADQREDSFFCL